MGNIKKISITKFIVFVVLFCTYIFPLGLIDNTYIVSKAIFMFFIALYYFLNFKKIRFFEGLFIIYLFILTIFLKDYMYLLFISIPLAEKIMEKKEIIIQYLEESNILYVCLLFTIGYSLLWFGEGGKFAFSAIKEVNQSSLSIFCLGVLLLKKNKKIGILSLIFGMFTYSRSYILAILLLLFSTTKFYKSNINKKIIKKISYFNIIILSSITFIVLGYYYIYQYKHGNIIYTTDLSNKFINLLDYSNFFRFTAILKILYIFINNPIKLFTGITSHEYSIFGISFSRMFNIPIRDTVPHNLFFSHLKIYGIISVVETIYISKMLSRIVDKRNFLIFISIALYSVILGAGLYSYWLYLTIFTLLFYSHSMKGEYNEK